MLYSDKDLKLFAFQELRAAVHNPKTVFQCTSLGIMMYLNLPEGEYRHILYNKVKHRASDPWVYIIEVVAPGYRLIINDKSFLSVELMLNCSLENKEGYISTHG